MPSYRPTNSVKALKVTYLLTYLLSTESGVCSALCVCVWCCRKPKVHRRSPDLRCTAMQSSDAGRRDAGVAVGGIHVGGVAVGGAVQPGVQCIHVLEPAAAAAAAGPAAAAAAGACTSDDDSGCGIDEFAWVPAGLTPAQVGL